MKCSSLRVSLLLVFSLAGCTHRLPDGEETLDLSAFGLNVKMTAPVGGKPVKGHADGDVEVRWGEHGENGSLELSRGRAELDCTAVERECTVVERGSTSSILVYKVGRHARASANSSIPVGASTIRCVGHSDTPDDARRLLAACKSIVAKGNLDAPAVSSATISSATAMPPLEELTFTDKPKGLHYTLRVPKGYRDEPTPAGGHMFVGSALDGGGIAPIITVTPYVAVKTVDEAEKEVKRNDIGGLDTIADKRSLGAKAFLVETAPRGGAHMMSVHVFAAGKKHALTVKCEGPAGVKPVLEAVCSSLHVD